MVAFIEVSKRWMPLKNRLHAKVVFRDTLKVIPRDAPMMIWLNAQNIWPSEDRDSDREWMEVSYVSH